MCILSFSISQGFMHQIFISRRSCGHPTIILITPWYHWQVFWLRSWIFKYFLSPIRDLDPFIFFFFLLFLQLGFRNFWSLTISKMYFHRVLCLCKIWYIFECGGGQRFSWKATFTLHRSIFRILLSHFRSSQTPGFQSPAPTTAWSSSVSEWTTLAAPPHRPRSSTCWTRASWSVQSVGRRTPPVATASSWLTLTSASPEQRFSGLSAFSQRIQTPPRKKKRTCTTLIRS